MSEIDLLHEKLCCHKELVYEPVNNKVRPILFLRDVLVEGHFRVAAFVLNAE
jgi:hypothetical protein